MSLRAVTAIFFSAACLCGAQQMPPQKVPVCDGTKLPSDVRITSDVQKVDFGPYLTALKSSVQRTWYSMIPSEAMPPLSTRGEVVIDFKIEKDGRISELEYKCASGYVVLDRAAWGGITQAAPFPPLPTEFKGDYLTLRFTFYFNPSPEIAGRFDNSAAAPNSAGSAHVAYEPSAIPEVNTVWPDRAGHPHPNDPGIGESVELGKPVHVVDPIIPAELRDKVLAVVFTGTMTVDGTFENLQERGGPSELSDAALKAIQQWRYSASTWAGKPGEAKVFIVVRSNKGNFSASVEPDLPVPTEPRKPIKEQISNGELFYIQPGKIQVPQATYAPDPEYSEAARVAKDNGTVVLGVILGSDGIPGDIWVIRKLGLGLDQKAIEAVRRWRFQPAMRDGKPIPVLLAVEVNFHIH